jgi:molecular chaperone HtpG
MAKENKATKKTILEPYIGSYVLETLTTGMYAESRNALREYVQNSFDSIRAAVRGKIIKVSEGRIKVTLPDVNTISVQDNGTGLSAVSALGTLTAIGLSKKARNKDAGFRGIGRLAGIAFCNTLSFRTKASGEATETTVTFDCRSLRTAMTSGVEESQPLAQLLQDNVKSATIHVSDAKAHYMVVTLKGLAQAPEEFKDLESIRDYLMETAPVDFDPSWVAGKEIASKATAAGFPIESVSIHLGTNDQAAFPVYKAYQGSIARKGGSVNIHEIKYFEGEESNWWAWVGLPDKPAMLTDERINGIRVRVRNIQIGRTAILDELFSEGNLSKERFNKYYVGEVHIGDDQLIPNARRDGFEDNSDWVIARRELRDVMCKPLAKRAYDLSKSLQKSIGVLSRDVAKLEKKVDSSKPIANDVRLEILHSAGLIRKKITSALADADGDTRVQLKSFVDSVDLVKQRLGATPASAAQIASLRTEILSEVVKTTLGIVEPYLEPQVFGRVRKALAGLK